MTGTFQSSSDHQQESCSQCTAPQYQDETGQAGQSPKPTNPNPACPLPICTPDTFPSPLVLLFCWQNARQGHATLAMSLYSQAQQKLQPVMHAPKVSQADRHLLSCVSKFCLVLFCCLSTCQSTCFESTLSPCHGLCRAGTREDNDVCVACEKPMHQHQVAQTGEPMRVPSCTCKLAHCEVATHCATQHYLKRLTFLHPYPSSVLFLYVFLVLCPDLARAECLNSFCGLGQFFNFRSVDRVPLCVLCNPGESSAIVPPPKQPKQSLLSQRLNQPHHCAMFRRLVTRRIPGHGQSPAGVVQILHRRNQLPGRAWKNRWGDSPACFTKTSTHLVTCPACQQHHLHLRLCATSLANRLQAAGHLHGR